MTAAPALDRIALISDVHGNLTALGAKEPAPSSPPTPAEALRAWLNERVGKTQRLSALHLIDELPRSAIGKVLKRELRERASADPERRSRA